MNYLEPLEYGAFEGDPEWIAPGSSRPGLSAKSRALSYSEVIDKRISVPAQHSLVRLSKNPATRAAAIGMLQEIKAGRLAGISCVNWRKAAERARRFGKSWGSVIPKGEDAVLMLDPDNLSGGPPLVAFRRELDPDCGLLKGEKRFASSPSRLDAALVKAWAAYKDHRISSGVTQPGRCGTSLRANRSRITEFEIRGCPEPKSCKRPGEKCEWVDRNTPKVCLFANPDPADDCQGRAIFFGMAHRWACLSGAIGPIPFETGHGLITALLEVQSRIAPQRIKEVHVFAHMFEEGIIGATDLFDGLYRSDIVHYRSRQDGMAHKVRLDSKNKVITKDDKVVCIVPRRHGAKTIQDIPLKILADDVVFVLHGCNTGNENPTWVVNASKENFASVLCKHLSSSLKNSKVFAHPTSVCVGQNSSWVEYSSQHFATSPGASCRQGRPVIRITTHPPYHDRGNQCCAGPPRDRIDRQPAERVLEIGNPVVTRFDGMPQLEIETVGLRRILPKYARTKRSSPFICTSSGRLTILDEFDFDSDRVQEFHVPELVRVATCVVASQRGTQPIRAIRLVGHTDTVGSEVYNLDLGRRRAEQVQRVLAQLIEQRQRGLAGFLQFHIESRGEWQQIPVDTSHNRRVEIFVSPERGSVKCRLPVALDHDLNLWLQRALNRSLETRLKVDGIFGTQTRNALISFQRQRGLAPTGILNGRTQHVLITDSKLPVPCELSDPYDIKVCPSKINCPNGAFAGTIAIQKITFDFCWSTLSFNPEPGDFPTLAKSKNRLRFSCHKTIAFQTNKLVCSMIVPAWEYEADVVARGAGLGKVSDWEFGFVQTVRSSRWLAIYSGGAGLACNINDTRDALAIKGKVDRPPWIMPVVAVQELCAGKLATMEDTPHADFPIIHPRYSKQTLRQVCFKADYEVWLAAKRKADPAGSLLVLGSKLIEIDRMWRLKERGNASSSSDWIKFGGQKQTNRRSGITRPRPVTSGATANQKQTRCFHVTSEQKCEEPPDFPDKAIGTPRCKERVSAG